MPSSKRIKSIGKVILSKRRELYQSREPPGPGPGESQERLDSLLIFPLSRDSKSEFSDLRSFFLRHGSGISKIEADEMTDTGHGQNIFRFGEFEADLQAGLLFKRGCRFIGSVEAPARAAGRVPSTRAKIVVLPFASLGGDPEQNYLSDTITEELITGLAGLV